MEEKKHVTTENDFVSHFYLIFQQFLDPTVIIGAIKNMGL